ncbi:uncharacterized protein [Argopecten irradians]|uniref:uncharacterized protein isoform X2 n=1 Tax=Argopecten irradians TaxID=31199 RepID=UPI003713729F
MIWGVYSSEAMENYRSLDAHVFFVSGWVQTVVHRKTVTGNIIAKADVKPSWRVTDEPHHPWVALKRDGPVITAHCDCMAGLGETCSHIGALLFKMEAAVRFGYTRSACTDESCLWNQCFTKDVKPAPISEIQFYKQEAKDRLIKKKRKKTMPTPASEEEQQTFLQSLSSLGENLVGLSAFKEFSGNFIGLGPKLEDKTLPPPLRELYSHQYSTASKEDLSELCDRTFSTVKISANQSRKIEELTHSQSSSLTWHHQRSGRITASVAGEVMNTSIEKPSVSLLKKICIPNTSSPNVPALNWGKLHEDDGYKLYQLLMESDNRVDLQTYPKGEIVMKDISGQHLSLNVHKAGFVIPEQKPFLGASPDGHVNCECCGKGLLEIKCPYNIRDKTIKAAILDNSFCLNASFSLKRSHKYFAQVQMQMYVCDGNYTDFVVWSPMDCVVTRINRDNGFISKMIEKLEKFWKVVVLPELLTRRLENSTSAKNSPDLCKIRVPKPADDDKTFCVCKTTDDNADMVGCDRCDNWFHPACLKLKRLPKSKTWYCPKCRREKKKQNTV